jgi:hypothetical protein
MASPYIRPCFSDPSTRPSNLPSRRAVCPRRHDRAKIDVLIMMTADWHGKAQSYAPAGTIPYRGRKRFGRFSKRPSAPVSKWPKVAILGRLICVGGRCAVSGVPVRWVFARIGNRSANIEKQLESRWEARGRSGGETGLWNRRGCQKVCGTATDRSRWSYSWRSWDLDSLEHGTIALSHPRVLDSCSPC